MCVSHTLLAHPSAGEASVPPVARPLRVCWFVFGCAGSAPLLAGSLSGGAWLLLVVASLLVEHWL